MAIVRSGPCDSSRQGDKLIHLGLGHLELDGGKNSFFIDNHSVLFLPNDIRQVPYFYAEGVVESKPAYARSLRAVIRRLEMLGYTLRECQCRYQEAVSCVPDWYPNFLIRRQERERRGSLLPRLSRLPQAPISPSGRSHTPSGNRLSRSSLQVGQTPTGSPPFPCSSWLPECASLCTTPAQPLGLEAGSGAGHLHPPGHTWSRQKLEEALEGLVDVGDQDVAGAWFM